MVVGAEVAWPAPGRRPRRPARPSSTRSRPGPGRGPWRCRAGRAARAASASACAFLTISSAAACASCRASSIMARTSSCGLGHLPAVLGQQALASFRARSVSCRTCSRCSSRWCKASSSGFQANLPRTSSRPTKTTTVQIARVGCGSSRLVCASAGRAAFGGRGRRPAHAAGRRAAPPGRPTRVRTRASRRDGREPQPSQSRRVQRHGSFAEAWEVDGLSRVGGHRIRPDLVGRPVRPRPARPAVAADRPASAAPRLPRRRPIRLWSRMMIRAKNVTPSISAAAMIMAVWMLPAISGCRAMLSTAALARLPMPSAAPMITSPAPTARRSENGAPAPLRRPCRRCRGLRERGSSVPSASDGGLDRISSDP